MDTLIDCILKMNWSNRHTDFAADDKDKYYRGFDFILLKKKTWKKCWKKYNVIFFGSKSLSDVLTPLSTGARPSLHPV